MSATYVYKSNNGKGPLLARVIEDNGDTVLVERWDPSKPKARRERFTLPSAFFDSAACGWKKVKVPHA